MIKIGLTGGIGCGKTTVARLFKKHGIPVIDADRIAHGLVEPGQQALKLIAKTFGPAIINNDGSLKRDRLRDMIFTDSVKKKQLESILHPLVYTEILNRAQLCKTAYVILCIPLLLETNMQHIVDRVLVIDCPPEMQILRVKNRDHISEQRIRSIINTQIPRQQRLSSGNDIIDNSGDITKLAEQIKKLHNLYLSLNTSQ